VKAQEIRELTDDEIDAQIETARAELFNLRFRASFEEADTGVIRTTRRTIARLLTIRQERQQVGDADV
jgi:large subunit ribosomal protein L29